METLRLLDAPYRAAVALLIDASGDVWLAQRSATCVVLPNQWECAAGKAEGNEDYETAALREIHEETGLVVERERLVPCGLVRTRGAGAMNVACALFMVQLADGERPQNTEPNKRSAWSRYGFPAALEVDSSIGTRMLLSILVEDRALDKSQLLGKYRAMAMALAEIADKVQPEKNCVACRTDDYDMRETCKACMERAARIAGMVDGIRKRVLP